MVDYLTNRDSLNLDMTATDPGDTPEAVVLVVEDNTSLRALFEQWLTPVYDVLTAATGDGALDLVSASVDVVLLDRNLPELSGDDVLGRIRARGLDCKVAMVTAVDPSTAIVDMDFDEYLVKPVDRPELLRTVEALTARYDYAEMVNRYFELTAKLGVLETTHTAAVLEADENYRQLVDEHREVADTLADQREALLASGDYDSLYADLPSD